MPQKRGTLTISYHFTYSQLCSQERLLLVVLLKSKVLFSVPTRCTSKDPRRAFWELVKMFPSSTRWCVKKSTANQPAESSHGRSPFCEASLSTGLTGCGATRKVLDPSVVAWIIWHPYIVGLPILGGSKVKPQSYLKVHQVPCKYIYIYTVQDIYIYIYTI